MALLDAATTLHPAPKVTFVAVEAERDSEGATPHSDVSDVDAPGALTLTRWKEIRPGWSSPAAAARADPRPCEETLAVAASTR